MHKIRKLDDLGRIVLPKEISAFGWTQKTELEITLEGNEAVVRASKPLCRLCGVTSDNLIEVGSGLLCQDCLDKAVEAAGR